MCACTLHLVRACIEYCVIANCINKANRQTTKYQLISPNMAQTSIVIPKPIKVVKYATSSSEPDRGALFLYGDPMSSKIAILCAGFADDHTVFQPFANELATKGRTFVGVMCLPGYDDRPEDGVAWQSHKPEGYTFDEWCNAVRDAAKVLRQESTNGNAKFTGIFHDWGVVPGTMWLSRLLKETDGNTKAWKPDNIVYFDVLLGPSPKAKDLPLNIGSPSMKETVCSWLYRIVFAKSFLIQRYVSKCLAAVSFVVAISTLQLLRLGPVYDFDTKSIEPLYKDKPKSLYRLCYMMYPYWSLFRNAFFGKNSFKDYKLHKDWKTTPILYMYGIKKYAQFHDYTSLRMLQREEQENRSLSKAIAVEDAGHFLYVQKQDKCVKAVIDFMDADASQKMNRSSSN